MNKRGVLMKILKVIYIDENSRVITWKEVYDYLLDNRAIIIDEFPDGQPFDYLYINGEFIYSPEE
jgi:hypothetical protein